MTPEEVLCETADKITRQLAQPLHSDLTKFGNEELEALEKLTKIFNTAKEAEAPRVENKYTNIKSERTQQNEKETNAANPRVKTQTPRVENLN